MRIRWASLSALVAGAVAVAVGLLVGGLARVVSPIDAVGSEVIDRSPGAVKEWAIRQFGTDDKLVLRVGIYVVLVLAALLIGALASRWAAVGPIGVGLFGVIGSLAALHRPDNDWLAAVPSVIGALVGIVVLVTLGRMASKLADGRTAQVPGWDPAQSRELPLPDEPAAVDSDSDSDSNSGSGSGTMLDRRRFFVAAGAGALAALVSGSLGVALDRRRIADLRAQAARPLPAIDGAGSDPLAATTPRGAQLYDSTPYLTPNADFYRIDTAFTFPNVRADEWTLTIDGLVDRPLRLNYADLLAREQVERIITLCCVSNEVGGKLVGNAHWQGVLLRDLLDEAGPRESAEQVFSTSVDGWGCGFPVTAAFDGRDAMVVLGMNGETLPLEHGFPARLVVPGLYGYVSATKWLERITLTTWDSARGYWLDHGWARDAPVKTQARIDVPRAGSTVPPGRQAIAGVAWAQHRGIERVEVNIGDGAWQEATLASDVTDDSWRQWLLEWDPAPGTYTLQVRATDKTGETQTESLAPSFPDGATGYHTVRVTVG